MNVIAERCFQPLNYPLHQFKQLCGIPFFFVMFRFQNSIFAFTPMGVSRMEKVWIDEQLGIAR
jgi:hypothetical protein